MALARQAQRCAVGKLDCYCGRRYRGDHDDRNDVQVRRANERNFILNFLDPITPPTSEPEPELSRAATANLREGAWP
jgi:hypothetical protein